MAQCLQAKGLGTKGGALGPRLNASKQRLGNQGWMEPEVQASVALKQRHYVM
jgi:hypothetical protein